MSEAPKFSVITIFLDAERFIAEAIESVLAQTREDWELLLVDDGSTDGSTRIAREYAARDPRIHYLEHPGHRNLGMSASRNLGLRHARGEYVSFLDSDDVYLPRKLAYQGDLLDAHPRAGMVCGATEYWYSWRRDADRSDWTWRKFGVPADGIVEPPTLLEVYLTVAGTAPCMGGLLVRRSIAKEVGGFEEAFRGLYEDQVFLAKLALHTPILVSSECLDRYRQHPDSECNTAPLAERQRARRRYLEWLEAHVEDVAPNARDLREYIRAAVEDLEREEGQASIPGRFGSGVIRRLKGWLHPS